MKRILFTALACAALLASPAMANGNHGSGGSSVAGRLSASIGAGTVTSSGSADVGSIGQGRAAAGSSGAADLTVTRTGITAQHVTDVYSQSRGAAAGAAHGSAGAQGAFGRVMVDGAFGSRGRR